MYELRTKDVEEYKRLLRMPPYLFDELLQLIETDIQKEATFMQEPIPLKVKLAATLKFLSSGMTTYFYLAKQKFLKKVYFFILNTIIQKIYDSPIRHQYISIESL